MIIFFYLKVTFTSRRLKVNVLLAGIYWFKYSIGPDHDHLWTVEMSSEPPHPVWWSSFDRIHQTAGTNISFFISASLVLLFINSQHCSSDPACPVESMFRGFCHGKFRSLIPPYVITRSLELASQDSRALSPAVILSTSLSWTASQVL